MLVLIADDDRLVRYSLKSMLMEIDPALIVEEAKNGREMIEKCNKVRPDIAFVDINMPYVDGISAIEQCMGQSPDTRFVVLTAYADFEYAQRSVRLQVTDYILKPISVELLAETFKKLETDIHKRQKTRLEEYQISLRQQFHLWDKADALQQDAMDSQPYFLCLLFLDGARQPTGIRPLLDRIMSDAEEQKAEWLRQGILLYTELVGQQMVRLVYRMPYDRPEPETEVLRHLSILCADISAGPALLSGLYGKCTGLAAVYNTCAALETEPFLRFLAKPGGAFPINRLPQNATAQAQFAKGVQQLMTDFTNADEVKYQNTLKRLSAGFPDIPTGISLFSIGRMIATFTGAAPQTGDSKTFYTSMKSMSRLMQSSDGVPAASKIGRIQDYIAKNYMNDISIVSISAQFGLTPNYLSSLFHDKTGVRFVEYLTEVRVTNSRKILERDTNVPVKDLAQMVGYTSPRHFTAQFKKLVGCYPSEYRKLHPD